MKPAPMLVVALMAFGSACSEPIAEATVCEVLAAPQKYDGRRFSAEVLLHANQHGWVAYDPRCGNRVIPVAGESWKKSPESMAAEQKLDQVSSSPELQGVAVHVTARFIQGSAKRCHALQLLTAGDSRIVDLPASIYARRDLPPSPPPNCG